VLKVPNIAFYIGTYVVMALCAVYAVITRGWGPEAWTFIGIAVVMALLHIGSWFREWWTVNLLRNQLDAKRRLRRDHRVSVDVPERLSESDPSVRSVLRRYLILALLFGVFLTAVWTLLNNVGFLMFRFFDSDTIID